MNLIDRLFADEWFINVGKPLGGDYFIVQNWSDSAEIIHESREGFMEAANDYADTLRSVAPKRYLQWNEVRELVVAEFESEVTRRVRELKDISEPDRQIVQDRINWTVLHACIETEFLGEVPAGFFLPLIDWYIEGRFPCGWHGTYPDGQLAIY